MWWEFFFLFLFVLRLWWRSCYIYVYSSKYMVGTFKTFKRSNSGIQGSFKWLVPNCICCQQWNQDNSKQEVESLWSQFQYQSFVNTTQQFFFFFFSFKLLQILLQFWLLCLKLSFLSQLLYLWWIKIIMSLNYWAKRNHFNV